jgi:hypothetical protein
MRRARAHACARQLFGSEDFNRERRGGVAKNGKSQTKKPAVQKPKAKKVKPAKQAKVAHRAKVQ